MPSYRRERADDFIREQFALLLREQIHDPRVKDLIITDVDLTQDRRIARVYVACYEGEEALKKGLEGLESAKSFFRRALSQLLTWRFVPEIEFRVDRSWQYGTRIEALLRDVEKQEAGQAEAEEGETQDSEGPEEHQARDDKESEQYEALDDAELDEDQEEPDEDQDE